MLTQPVGRSQSRRGGRLFGTPRGRGKQRGHDPHRRSQRVGGTSARPQRQRDRERSGGALAAQRIWPHRPGREGTGERSLLGESSQVAFSGGGIVTEGAPG